MSKDLRDFRLGTVASNDHETPLTVEATTSVKESDATRCIPVSKVDQVSQLHMRDGKHQAKHRALLSRPTVVQDAAPRRKSDWRRWAGSSVKISMATGQQTCPSAQTTCPAAIPLRQRTTSPLLAARCELDDHALAAARSDHPQSLSSLVHILGDISAIFISLKGLVSNSRSTFSLALSSFVFFSHVDHLLHLCQFACDCLEYGTAKLAMSEEPDQ